MLNTYELALVLHPSLDEAGRGQLVELVEKMTKQFGGEVSKREEGGKKQLAYPILKQGEGWYYFLTLQLPGESVSKLDTKLRVEDKVLRYLLTTKKQKNLKTEKQKSKRTKKQETTGN